MARHEKQKYVGDQLQLDGNEYIGCIFERCTLMYSGVADIEMQGSQISDCQWVLNGPAASAMKFLSALYHGGAAQVVEATFDNIRGRSTRGFALQ